MKKQKRWAVHCDGEYWLFHTRAEAREQQRWLSRHPSNVNIRRFGPYQNADGVAEVIDLGDRTLKEYLAFQEHLADYY